MLYCTVTSDEVIYNLGGLRWDVVNKNVYTVMLNKTLNCVPVSACESFHRRVQ